MASKPGILTDWPWTPLETLSTYSFMVKDEKERDLLNFLIFPFLLWRMLHNQIWISLSRYRTAKGRNRIVDKHIEIEQVDRERNWDDQIILSGILFYIILGKMLPGGTQFPIWRLDGVILMALLHAGPVEFVYYWLHRALHHHYLYSRSHHHSSIVPEPITSVTRPFAEHITYFVLFATPLITTALTGAGSIVPAFGYITYIDLMNNMGHCHSLHHTQLRANYSLFMPLYDYLFSTVDKTSDTLYETKAILEAEEKGARVISLGLLNQGEELNRYGGLFVHKNPELKIKVVDGSSLAVAVLTNSILTKVAYATAFALCQKGIQIIWVKSESKNLLVSRSYCQKVTIYTNIIITYICYRYYNS
ncbi:Very-long-chain aldehyde decarbonylase CER1 [Citrus sinensis]|uniref:Very-long-chain aldehyde decarbonylase CER1 n=1 Tax=Citrus sinensis TaxID=2711 RepID=A0ACB8JT22_CITSI|nr:Very-long-chain aldehyde decarbonylase CER1 [Citrus sinensis]